LFDHAFGREKVIQQQADVLVPSGHAADSVPSACIKADTGIAENWKLRFPSCRWPKSGLAGARRHVVHTRRIRKVETKRTAALTALGHSPAPGRRVLDGERNGLRRVGEQALRGSGPESGITRNWFALLGILREVGADTRKALT
jgi:hypothetical protein